MIDNNLPQINNHNEITPQLIMEMVKDEIKDNKNFDALFFAMKARENPSVPWPYILEFIKKAAITGADPRLNQIYLIPSKKWDSNTRQNLPMAHTVFAYQFFMDKAYQTELMEYFTVDTKIDKYFTIENGKPKIIDTLISNCIVKRKDMGKEISYKAHFPEFYKDSPVWKKSPYLMLEKCSIANAMRRAFPEYLTGLYIKDEMPEAIKLNNNKQNEKPIRVEAEVKKNDNLKDDDLYQLKDEIWKLIGKITDNYINKEMLSSVFKELGVKEIKELSNHSKKELETHLSYLKLKWNIIVSSRDAEAV